MSAPKKRSLWLNMWRRLQRNRRAMVGLGIIVFLVLLAIFAPMIAPYGYDDQNLDDQFLFPSAKHLMGTDNLGRDIFSRVVYGSRMYREMSSSKPIYTIDDFKGVRIRTMENRFHMNFWNSLGASATPINFAELYLSLQQGLVDAQENPIAVVVLNGFYEQQDYVILTDHVLFFIQLVTGLDTYNSMSDAQRAVLHDFIDTASPRIAEGGEAEDAMFTAQAVEKGIEILAPSDQLVADMKDVALGTSAMIAEDVGDDLVESLFSSLEAAAGR